MFWVCFYQPLPLTPADPMCLKGHWYLTILLLPVLLSTAKSAPNKKVRVVNTTSGMHLLCNHLDYEILKDSPKRKKAGVRELYAQSKFASYLLLINTEANPSDNHAFQAMVVYSTELARRYGEQGLVSISLHPGLCFHNKVIYTVSHFFELMQVLSKPIYIDT